MEFLTHIITASLFCVGLRVATDTGMILGRPAEFILTGKWGETQTKYKGLPRFFHKPLLDCAPCMASSHGTWYYLAFVGFDIKILLFVFCVCGLNAVFVKYFG